MDHYFFEGERGRAISPPKIPEQQNLLKKIVQGQPWCWAGGGNQASTLYYPGPVHAQAIVHQKYIIYTQGP